MALARMDKLVKKLMSNPAAGVKKKIDVKGKKCHTGNEIIS
jgi:hypothetical protein